MCTWGKINQKSAAELSDVYLGGSNMINLTSVSAGYGELQILYDVSISVARGEVVALVGANGAGKSTLIKTILGLLPISSGEIEFEKVSIKRVKPHNIIKYGISLVPEGRRLFPFMTVLENLELGAYIESSRKKIKDNLEWVLGIFPKLRERRKQLAGTFSGGEQQMLTIGRALMSRPKFIILDEPSLGLAPVIVNEVFDTINLLLREGVTIFLVEQNVRRSLEIANRAYVLEHGRVVMNGNSNDLMENEEVKKAYLGI
jgi:branched-chain amino acid transport system ATP-binding protein